ncbi:hypothetical protein BGX26_012600 [Mortierella sp. AD094]|nr:hypothetical protein BGX26_012600 [Mortierella sp. AD094]
MATLSPYHTYTPSSNHSSSSSSSSSHAEALLSRARQLSSNAYERSRASAPPPLSFAEGEDFNLPSPTAKSTSPYLGPTASRSSASLHQLHRNSFNEHIRDHGRRRSSQAQRLSNLSSASASTKTPSPLSSEFPSDSSSSSAANDSSTLVSESTTAIALMRISQQTSQGTTIEPSPGDRLSTRKHDDYKERSTNAHTATSSDCPTIQTPMTPCSHATTQPLASTLETQENTSKISFSIEPPSATYTTTSFQPSPSAVHRKHRSDIGRGDRYIVDILGALRENEQSSSGTHSQSESATSTPVKQASPPSGTPFTTSTSYVPRTMYGPTTDTPQDQSRITQQKRNQANTFAPFATPSCTPSEQDSRVSAPTTASTIPMSPHPFDLPATVPAQHPALDQATDKQRASRSDSISSLEKTYSPTSDGMSIHSRDSSSHSLTSSLLSAPPQKKERRSSRLLGKLMPKFLHSSHGSSSSSSSTSSPQSAGGESHLGTPTDTKSGLTTGDIYNKSTLPSLPLPEITSSTLPALPESVIGMDHDWLAMKSDMGTVKSATSFNAVTPTTPVLSSATLTTIAIESPATQTQIASSYSSYSSHSSLHSFKIEEYSEQSTETFKEVQEHRPSSLFKVEVEDEEEEREEMRMYAIEQEQSNEADYSSYSPYTIDEDCDDDFFLNSVLRKKTRPHSMLPSISIGASWSSPGRTPSLSTSFTSSSQASSTVPSPTTSLPPMPSTLSPTPVSYYGMDEKRSRLSDAVKEWRRSASASLGSTYSMTYSGF